MTEVNTFEKRRDCRSKSLRLSANSLGILSCGEIFNGLN